MPTVARLSCFVELSGPRRPYAYSFYHWEERKRFIPQNWLMRPSYPIEHISVYYKVTWRVIQQDSPGIRRFYLLLFFLFYCYHVACITIIMKM